MCQSVTVTLLHTGEQRQTVKLSGVPRRGDSIRLRFGRGDGSQPTYIVEHVLWMEAAEPENGEPMVLVVVRRHVEGVPG